MLGDRDIRAQDDHLAGGLPGRCEREIGSGCNCAIGQGGWEERGGVVARVVHVLAGEGGRVEVAESKELGWPPSPRAESAFGARSPAETPKELADSGGRCNDGGQHSGRGLV